MSLVAARRRRRDPPRNVGYHVHNEFASFGMASNLTHDPMEPAPVSAPSIGTVLEGRYRLTRPLGEGGVGVVFEAEHLKLGRAVAVKVLQSKFVSHAFMRSRFDREAKALAALSHPNIVSITDYGIANELPYLVMELIRGRTLRSVLDEEGRLQGTRALHITSELLRGLTYAHRQGVVHRDLKPGNIMLLEPPSSEESSLEQLKILDFGFVKFFSPDVSFSSSLTQSGVVFGTIGYMPPEQIFGGETGPHSDVYSVGILLYEMLTGIKPFQGDPPEVARQHLTEAAPPMQEVCPAIKPSSELNALLMRALSKKHYDRYENAAQFLDAIQRLPAKAIVEEPNVRRKAPHRAHPGASYAAGSGDPNATDSSLADSVPWPRPSRVRRRKQRVVIFALVGTLALAAIASAALWWPRSTNSTRTTPQNVATEGASSPATSHSGDVRAEESNAEAAEPTTFLAPSPPDTTEAPPEVIEPETPMPTEVTAKNPWRTRRPALLTRTRRAVIHDRVLGREQIRALRSYARKARSDARPHLVLAQSYANDGALSAALERYELAHQFDPESRGDPRMLRDLLRFASDKRVGLRAEELLVRAFSTEALGALERMLERPETRPAERARLEHVRDRILLAAQRSIDSAESD